MDSTQPNVKVTTTKTNQNIPLQVENVQTRVGQPQAPRQPRGKKLHISKFLVLVNSNLAVQDLDQANRVAECLKEGTGKALEQHAPEIFFIKKPAKESFDSETVKDIKVKVAAEIGPRYKRIHVHALVTVKHYTLLQMDNKVLRSFLLKYCVNEEIGNLFVRIRFVPVSDFAELYLEKSPI